MKTWAVVTIVALLAFPVRAADADAGLAAVGELGQANGLALACGDKETISRAKNLMLQHAPKTPRYGQAFEQATQQGFLAQVKGPSTCPEARAVAERIEGLAQRLRVALPAKPK